MLKDWKKIGNIYSKTIDEEKVELQIDKDTEIEGKNKWFVEVYTINEEDAYSTFVYEKFKDKKDALKFAKRWMGEH